MRNTSRCSIGQASVEFVALVIFVGLAVAIFYPTIRNTISGRWHLAGDSLSFGMVYQPGQGVNCSYDSQYNIWYQSDCFETKNCDQLCFSSIPTTPLFPNCPICPPPPDPPDYCQLCLSQCTAGCQ